MLNTFESGRFFEKYESPFFPMPILPPQSKELMAINELFRHLNKCVDLGDKELTRSAWKQIVEYSSSQLKLCESL